MCRRIIFLIFLVLMLSLVGRITADTFFWDDGGADHLWSTAENWEPNVVPDSNDKATFEPISGQGAIIDSTMTGAKKAVADYVVLGHNNTGTAASLTINGGELDVHSRIYFGDKDGAACTGILNMNSGTISLVGSAEKFYVGYKQQTTGYVYMNDGTINAPRVYLGGENINSKGYIYMKGGTINVSDRMFIGGHGAGYLYMSGGTINAEAFSIAENDSATTYGEVHLDGGTIMVGGRGFRMRNMGDTYTGLLDIKNGKLIISGNVVSTIQHYVSKGWITANGSNDPEAVKIVYENGKTTVTAAEGSRATDPSTAYGAPSAPFSEIASNPNPVEDSEDVLPNAVLSWSPGALAASHDVYFSTDFNDVNEASRPAGDIDCTGKVDFSDIKLVSEQWLWDPGGSQPSADLDGDHNVNMFDFGILAGDWMKQCSAVYKGNQPLDANSYDPFGLELAKTYYWRIDEVNNSDTWRGGVWKFTTKTPAFPGAEGAGMWAVGGRGGAVYEVTNLNDDGYGSLREAVEAGGPRIVVFRCGGTIELLSRLKVEDPYITIAGQTAPGDGICLKDYGFQVSADHVIVRYIRFRLGDNAGVEADSVWVSQGRNIIIDHCSASWSVDETLSVATSSNNLGNATIQWCIISESLNCSIHEKDCHGYGSLVRGGYNNIYTFHHNLYAHHRGRSPRPGNYNNYVLDPYGLIFDFRNNVVYNWGGSYAGYNADSDSITKMNFVGNYYIEGNNSSGDDAFREQCTYSRAYFNDNWMNDSCPLSPWSLVYFDGFTSSERALYKQSSPIPITSEVTTDDALTAYTLVLADAGATVPERDAVDVRIVNDVMNGTGYIIDDEDEVGGWPELASGTPPVDTDHDGMPDDWELARGLDPYDDGDSSMDRDGDGYTNIEEYINELCLSI